MIREQLLNVSPHFLQAFVLGRLYLGPDLDADLGIATAALIADADASDLI